MNGRSVDREIRTRRAIARALPFLLAFFVVYGGFYAVDGEWGGVGWAGFCFVAALVALLMNRRWLSENQSPGD